MRVNKRQVAFAAGIVLSCAMLAWVIYANFAMMDLAMNNDHAAEMVFAKMLGETGGLLSRDWFYSTEIRIFGIHIVYKYLFYVLSDWGTVRAVGNSILYLVMIGAYGYLARRLHLRKEVFTLSLPFLLMAPGFYFYVMTVTYAFYLPHIIVAFFYLGLVLHIGDMPKEKPKRRAALFVVLAVLSFLCGAAGVRYLKDILLPLLLTVFLLVITSEHADELRKTGKIAPFLSALPAELKRISLACAVGAGAMLAGYIYNVKVLALQYSFFDTGSMTLAGGNRVFSARIAEVLTELVAAFGYKESVDVLSLRGIACVLAVIVPGVIAYMAVRLLRQLHGGEKTGHRLIALYTPCAIVCCMLTMLFVDTVIAERYYIPHVIMLVPLFAVFISDIPHRVDKIAIAALLAVTLTANTYFVYAEQRQTDEGASYSGVIRFLEENDLQYGYATFWYSDVLTYLTDGQVRMAHLTYNDSGVYPFEWLSPKAYYQPGYATGDTFLLLTAAEAEQLKDAAMLQHRVPVYSDEKFVIFEYAAPEFDALLYG